MISLKISMTKFFFLLIFLCFSAFAQDKTPPDRKGTEYGIDFRMLKKYRRYLLMAETKNRREITDHMYNQVMLGSYYRLTKRFRMGVFFQAEQGLRWDEDWAKGAVWQWQKMNNRWDFSSVLDATYMDKINRNWVWEMKGRLFYYHSRDAIQMRLRPGVRYFVISEGKPTWQIFTEFEGYVPLNYGKNLCMNIGCMLVHSINSRIALLWGQLWPGESAGFMRMINSKKNQDRVLRQIISRSI